MKEELEIAKQEIRQLVESSKKELLELVKQQKQKTENVVAVVSDPTSCSKPERKKIFVFPPPPTENELAIIFEKMKEFALSTQESFVTKLPKKKRNVPYSFIKSKLCKVRLSQI